MEKNLSRLEKKIGYQFRDRKLLRQALSHSSYTNEHPGEHTGHNERLEFLGDAVLEIISSDFLYHAYPEMPEGKLTRLRASLVCEPTLAACAREIELDQFLMLGKGEELTGGRKRDSIISDALEAVIGSIYLDGGYETAKRFVEQTVLTDIEHKKLFYDSKTVLQEIVQRDYRGREIQYLLVGEEGPDHAKSFRVDVMLGEQRLGSGVGNTKKAAEQNAAYQAILLLQKD